MTEHPASMTNPARRYYIAMCILFLAVFSFPTPAGALPQLPLSIVERIAPVFDLPAAEYGGKRVGYQYTSIRLFSFSLFIIDSQLVLYDDDKTEDLSGPELEKIERTYGSMTGNIPLWLRYRNSFLLLVYICVFVFVLKRHFAED